jgi:hypothetical protein
MTIEKKKSRSFLDKRTTETKTKYSSGKLISGENSKVFHNNTGDKSNTGLTNFDSSNATGTKKSPTKRITLRD